MIGQFIPQPNMIRINMIQIIMSMLGIMDCCGPD